MSINWKLPGWTWAKNTAEVAGVTFAVTLYGAWQSAPTPDLLSIPWKHALSMSGYEVVGVVLYAIVSLRIPNGTFSRIKNVVAADKVPADAATPK